MLSEKTANSNREGHDAHAPPAAPWQGARRTCASTPRLTHQDPESPDSLQGQRRWSVIMPATMITDNNPGRPLAGKYRTRQTRATRLHCFRLTPQPEPPI